MGECATMGESTEIDNLRLNQINDAQKELKVIETAASLRKGSKDLPLVITSVTRHPRGLFLLYIDSS